MALFEELAGIVIFMVTKPFSLIKRFFIFGLRGICVVINTWVEILSTAFCIHVYIFWRLVVWIVSLISLPARALAALRRERLLEEHLDELQNRLDTFIWDRKELQERIQLAIKERAMMEVMLTELEEEHDQAIHKIEVLETELLDLKDENHRLKDVHSKSLWSSGDQVLEKGYDQKVEDAIKGILSWKSSYNGSGITIQDLLMHKDVIDHENKCKTEADNLLKTQSGPIHQFMPTGMISRNLNERRDVALSQSLFSAILSLLVGMIIWKAEDPCIPLVLALFTVVGMSLKSVVQFFSTIKNKPASDAVALLSFNWFILGTLTYPTLPRVAPMVIPFVISFFEQTLGWVGLSFLVS